MPEIIPNLHPLFVHFPIVLISVSALFHIAAVATQGKSCASYCAILAHATLWLGALAALPTAWYGGELVYRHGLGVLSLPVAGSGQMHVHKHGSMMEGGEHVHDNVMHSEDDHYEHSHDKQAH